MKTPLFVIALLLGHVLFAQFRIDPQVQHRFDSLFNLQPKGIQKKRFLEGFDNGLALLLNFKEDTLNISEFSPQIKDTSIHIIDIDIKTGEKLPGPPIETTTYNPWFPSKATYSKDTLVINSFVGFYSGLGFTLKIINEKSLGEYYEYGDSIYRHNFNSSKSPEILVKALAENVTISSLPKKPGDIFYGQVTLVTEPFFEDDPEFRNGYRHKRSVITYLFTCKLIVD